MRYIADEVRRLLGPLDPAASGGDGESLPDRGERDLARILADRMPPMSAPGPSRRVRRRRSRAVAGVAGMVAVAATVVVAVPRGGSGAGTALAATPPPLTFQPASGSAPTVLRELAEHVRQEAASEERQGRYQHIVVRRWSLGTRVDGTTVTSVVLPSRTELWIAPDGSATQTTRYDTPRFDDPRQRAAWEAQGSPGGEQRSETTRYPGGAFPRMWRDAGPPPGDLAGFTRWLQIGHPAGNGPVETLVAWQDLSREYVPDAVTRANLLSVAAGLTGLVQDGRTTDRAGRPGIAFSITNASSGLPTKHTVIVDPHTGALLASEEMLTETAGKLNVRVPAVISYDIYLASARSMTGPTR